MQFDTCLVQDGFDTHAREFIDDFKAEMGQDSVFPSDGHNVGRDADGHQVHAGKPQLVGQFEFLTISLDKLEAHATA